MVCAGSSILVNMKIGLTIPGLRLHVSDKEHGTSMVTLTLSSLKCPV